ncbi:MAG: hypothetical protein AVDCRST_MAG16-2671 [uncultured Frankineae bacterium]|uniref:DUF1684 domain-containing protein n=1 Tax=uncultured Frankineae bacterium TaxID=437475 RepID=A0A6J4MF14_9ACTN|nr:MAG: hypothetical protein AVDCRST_MAG16-2671 [uncultured Frankineae bacterium]
MATASLTLLDWRRRVFALYAEVRTAADPAQAHALWRTTRDELFASHADSPLLPQARSSFAGLPVAPYDPAWRFEAEVDGDVEPAHLEIPTGTDGVVRFDRLGVARLPGVGELDVWWLGSYGGGVFVPVKDSSAGTRTYGGGRYLLDTVKGADLGGSAAEGRLVLDLNFAYNPSCAYDPAWACPLAPPGNVLDVEVPVGETVG